VRTRSLHLWTWGASLALHVGLVSGFSWLALHKLAAQSASPPRPVSTGDGTIAVELPRMAEGTLETQTDRPPDPRGDPPHYFGGAPQAELDDGRLGRAGAPTTVAHPTNLSDRDEQIHLAQDLRNELDTDQQQRMRNAPDRASREDRRASREPMELSFLASGDGARAERRPPTDADPSRGARMSLPASMRGTELGAADPSDGDLERRPDLGSPQEGAAASAAGVGVHDGRVGLTHRAGAHVMHARPDVVLAAVSVPATRRGRARDDIDSDQEVAATLRSIVHASTAAGARGEGTGGVAGGGAPGVGGATGTGSTGRPLGPGDAQWWDLDTSDARLFSYFRRIHQKLDPLWAHAFPLHATLELRQGLVIFAVTIAADGQAQVDWPPLRPSGVPEFDRNCYEAILRAAPFGPIPAALGVSELRVRMPFDARNPVVR
jgi:hypothetical protein